MTQRLADLFDANYYRTGCGVPYERSAHWLAFFGQIAEHIVAGIGPRTVLDAGCAMGLLVEALRERGVEAYGLDISEYAISQVPEVVRPYCWVGSVLDPLPRRYDLVISIEVLEHMPAADSERALANLCQATDDFIFSSTPSDLTEPTHFNVQPPDYWGRLFAEQGFIRDTAFDAGFITPWAARWRRSAAAVPAVVAAYERALWHEGEAKREARRNYLAARAELAAAEARFAAKEAELQRVLASPGWQTLQALGPLWRRLAPPGSRRERWFWRALRRQPNT